MPRVGFETTIPAFKQALDRAVTLIVPKVHTFRKFDLPPSTGERVVGTVGSVVKS
jgi:hypothetical protein